MKKVNFFQALFLVNMAVGSATAQPHLSLQPNKTLAVISIDAKGLVQSPEDLANIARMEMQKHDDYTVLRHYDVVDKFKGTDFDTRDCYSVSCLTEAGKQLGADVMLSGSAERISEHIVINLVLVDVHAGRIIASDVNDYYNIGTELEGMMKISINNLLGIESDDLLLNALQRKEGVVNEQIVERLKLNGPRMGVGYVGGLAGQRLMDAQSQNGFDLIPVMTQFGYQFEWQYMSAGNMQALVEVIPMISGLDQARIIPSLTMLNGFRHSRSGLEVAFGPSVRISKLAKGYYDENKVWHRQSEWEAANPGVDNPHYEHKNLDSKGHAEVSPGFIVAAGKTFRSGHMNIPVNVYMSIPNKSGFLTGVSVGFNVRSKRG